jgi:periplasmic divalent cation tolerance protein
VPASGYVLVMCAAGTRENAGAIAAALVSERLAACVQLLPMTSVYRWHGAVATEAEIMLHIKTTAGRIRDVEALIRRLHSYELPEIAWIEIAGGSAEYLGWISASVTPAESS